MNHSAAAELRRTSRLRDFVNLVVFGAPFVIGLLIFQVMTPIWWGILACAVFFWIPRVAASLMVGMHWITLTSERTERLIGEAIQRGDRANLTAALSAMRGVYWRNDRAIKWIDPLYQAILDEPASDFTEKDRVRLIRLLKRAAHYRFPDHDFALGCQAVMRIEQESLFSLATLREMRSGHGFPLSFANPRLAEMAFQLDQPRAWPRS